MAALFGRRLRKGMASAALAAAAVAALSASQAPGLTDSDTGRHRTDTPAADTDTDPGATDDSYYTDLPPLNSPTETPSSDDSDGNTGDTEAGIPATVLDAYKKAEAALAESKPGCNLPWELLAAIGWVESGQARGGRVDANGTTLSPILGPPLNGNGFAKITDTDGGAYDGDTVHDRAVGPMQFIPSTWESWGSDGNADGKKDPNNIYDAALAAGRYLCAGDRDLSVTSQLHAAILSYNHSQDYLNTVLKWLEYYRKGTHEVPDGRGALPTDRSDDSDGPSPSPSPTPPVTTTPNTPKPGGTKPGGGTTSPAPAEPGSPSPSPTPPTATETVARLEDAGTGELTAMAGDAFGERVSVRAESASGVGVPKVRVRFTIVGDTDATFTGGETVATVTTSATGTATAPTLQAGEKTGDFTVRAAVVGRTLSGLDYTATVTERQADTLVRTSDTTLTCTPGGQFAEAVEVKATYKGAVADGVAATATLVKSADDPTQNDKGPYFKDADGNPVRTLTGLETDANGLLKLPQLYADDTTGTFLLRINTTGGATLTVELTVEAATAS
ncbi:lytic transglycosylase domain-containing protein [Streptomyces jeddahensis]|uniref:Transglycosylase SLT domain-containing protein n=1 Tax=Streptomyces jeddahensis TaxID=1716141 RepID=A0A177HYZ9_9ACTN|nr:lytic transglycosylase domain-containing protein [Streptomyces jeddahensis]OAH16006.1 hypothetical protein STSP_05290 [Streptomyces jeddahensis]